MQTHGQVLGVIVFLCLAMLLAIGGLVVNKWLSKSNPSEAKSLPYESGEAPAAGGWGQLDMRFYRVGLLFLLFEVELVFLFPWAAVVKNGPLDVPAADWKLWMKIEGLAFVGILALGLAYAWKIGMLDWYRVKPTPKIDGPDQAFKPDYEAYNQQVKTVLPKG